MNALDCIKSRRSIRKFTSEKVEHEMLEQAIEAASFAPSWKNSQIARYIAVEDETVKSEIADFTASFNAGYIKNAPVLIVLTYIKGRCGYERDGSFSTSKKEQWQMFDAGIAAQTFCLAAHELGLGSVILGIFDAEGIHAYLNLEPDVEVAALIPLGLPNISPETPKRKTVTELLTYR